MTRFFVDADGQYIGGFDGADPPPGAIEVPAPPDDARCKWDGSDWLPFSPPYDEARRAAYPPLGDQLDAMWKIVNQLRLGGENLPQPGDDMLNAILAVKAANPKPEDD